MLYGDGLLVPGDIGHVFGQQGADGVFEGFGLQALLRDGGGFLEGMLQRVFFRFIGAIGPIAGDAPMDGVGQRGRCSSSESRASQTLR